MYLEFVILLRFLVMSGFWVADFYTFAELKEQTIHVSYLSFLSLAVFFADFLNDFLKLVLLC